MSRPVELLRRYGLAVGLTAAAGWVLIDATLPALQERREAQARRRAAEDRVEQARDQVRQGELWLQGVSADPYTRERLADGVERSPDLVGSRVLPSSELPADAALPGDATEAETLEAGLLDAGDGVEPGADAAARWEAGGPAEGR